MLSGKAFVTLLLCVFIFAGCNKTEEQPEKQEVKNQGPTPQQTALAKLRLKNNSYIFGNFNGTGDSTLVAVETETKDIKEYVKFKVFSYAGEYKQEFISDRCEGAATGFILQVVSNGLPYAHCLYTTGDYFIGKSSGEVFAYLFDVKKKIVYPAHLFFIGDKVRLYLPSISSSEPLATFFVNYFKKDFPEITISQEDYKMPF